MNTPNSEPITGPGITWAMEQIDKRFNPSMKKEPVEQSAVETQKNSTPRSLHTPEPWMVEHGTLVTSENKTIVAVKGELNVAQANARLIAAAPELLEALRPFSKFACDPPCECHNCRARAVISKAEGKAE